MKITAKYKTIMSWYQDCDELLVLYQNDNSLTMDIEWAILQNYRSLSNVISLYEKSKRHLVEKYGALQKDGTTAIDETDAVTRQQYQDELTKLENSLVRVNIQKVHHKSLSGVNGVTLETMSLFEFMIS